MSQLIALSSKLAKGYENGLDSLHDSLVDDPSQVICVIGWFTCPKITTDVETGESRITLQLRVEPIATVEKVPSEVMKLALDLYGQRTGKTPLPFDVVETLDGGYVHPDRHLDDEAEGDDR